MGTGNGNRVTSEQAPISATALAAGSFPTALAAPAPSTASAVPAITYAGQIPESISASKPAIQDKVSPAPSKVDKIGAAVETDLIKNLIIRKLEHSLIAIHYSNTGTKILTNRIPALFKVPM
jgi:hypothetical protein